MTTPAANFAPRDHGGGLDAAITQFGGSRGTWVDLSTGINPTPYSLCGMPHDAWTALPDSAAQRDLIDAARQFWNVPQEAAILAAPGASSLIARLPALWANTHVEIQTPTYNEHAGAFAAHGWTVNTSSDSDHCDMQVAVHPNNPDGRFWRADEFGAPRTIIDESFCDIAPQHSHIERAARSDTIILKSFGKFWGLAGLRLGFAIGAPEHINRLNTLIGPWAVSGPALRIGTQALRDTQWAEHTRTQLQKDSQRLDDLMQRKGAKTLGGTSLFRLYEVDDAQNWQSRLARGHVWSRIFPYSKHWLRLGLPARTQWTQFESAL